MYVEGKKPLEELLKRSVTDNVLTEISHSPQAQLKV